MANQIRTTILLAVMTAFILWVGKVIGGNGGMVIALAIAGAMNFFSYWYSDKIVLRMYKAQEVTPNDAPRLYAMVAELAKRAGLPMPRVYIIPQEAPNAFATGRNPENAVVAVTEGLLKYMNQDELAGVLAHELGHIKNRDILIGSIAATMAGGIMLLANMAKWGAIFGGFRGNDNDGGGIFGLLAMAIIAPIAAMIIQMAISRSREYLADTTSADITGDSEGLARALEKLGAYNQRIPMEAQASTAHMLIASPLSGRNLTNLFSTHPPIEERVARLRNVRPERRTVDSPNSSASGGNMTDQARNFWNNLS